MVVYRTFLAYVILLFLVVRIHEAGKGDWTLIIFQVSQHTYQLIMDLSSVIAVEVYHQSSHHASSSTFGKSITNLQAFEAVPQPRAKHRATLVQLPVANSPARPLLVDSFRELA